MPNFLNRREFCVLGSVAFAAKAWADCDSGRLRTPYKVGRLVLTASGKKGAYDSISVDGPFVFRYQNRFYMTFVAFDGIGYQTGLASSQDLNEWRKEGAVLKRDPSSPILKYNVALSWILRENDLYSPGRLKRVDGDFVGAYHAYPKEGLEQGAAVIGLAHSKDLRHWAAGPPILRSEDGAPWERGGLYKPCLVEYGGVYYLFYNAKNQTEGRWHEQIGVATSKDLKQWTRSPANPIISNGTSLDARFASDPCVLRDGRLWTFFYYGVDAKGVARDLAATGPNLTHPTKCPEPLIVPGSPGSVDSLYAHKPSLVARDGVLYHFYCAVSRVQGQEVRGISVARSRPWKS